MPRTQCHAAAVGQQCSMPCPVPDINPAQEFPKQCNQLIHIRRNVSCLHRRHSGSSRSWTTAATYTAAVLLLSAALLAPQVEARKQGLRAAAQPCIECSQCLTASCQRICSPSCRGGRGGGGGIILNGDQCKYRGEEAADAVADDACRAAQGMCQAGTKSSLAFQSSGGFSASECAAIANGACSRAAQSSQNTPCGVYLYFGFRSCSGRQFSDMYKSRVVSLCKTATSGY